MAAYNWISQKRPFVHNIHFYILVKFNIPRNVCASLSVRVSSSGQRVNCTRIVFLKITCHNLHNYTPSCFTHHHTLIHTHMIQPTNNVFVPAYHLCQKISYEKNISQYTQLQSCTLHTPLYTFTYGNIYAPY